ncbi:FHA domain-containing protein [Nonomuraea sp. NPDC049421]|uniref:FHA domain-containing protein n=1 Tax=Nonomuraea sp. NPDC049421 TaxID=3155275 RepID=UPI00343C6D99
MKVVGAAVDVSNVCWSPRIDPLGRQEPLLSRLDVIRQAWHRLHGDTAPLTLIGDLSLLHQLSQQDVDRCRQLVDSGELILVSYADPDILALAHDKGLHVISADQFIDHRRAHPWIVTAPERFLTWTQESDGLRLVPSGIRAVPQQEISRREEAKELGYQFKIDVRRSSHKRVLRSEWRCTTASCLAAMSSPDRLLSWPKLGTGGAVLCPSCAQPLQELGARGLTVVIVIADRDTGQELLRFPMGENGAIVIGRGNLPYGINLAASGLPFSRAAGRVSRQHVKLQVTAWAKGARVTAVDLGSKNGTAVKRFGSPAERRLAHGEQVFVGDKDELVLAGGVVVRQSGQRFFSGSPLAPDLDDGGGFATSTAHEG